MPRSSIAGTLLALVSVSGLMAQAPVPLKAGDDVRVTLRCSTGDSSSVCDQISGKFTSRSPDTLWMIGNERAGVAGYAQTRIRSVEKQVSSSHRGKSALIGVGVGAAMGVVVSFPLWQGCGSCEGNSPAAYSAQFAVIGGLLGAGVGALLGSSTHWEVVSPVPGAIGIGFAWGR